MEAIRRTTTQSNLLSVNMMKVFLDNEIGEDLNEAYMDYFEEDMDIAYIDDENEEEYVQSYAAARENEAIGRVKNRQAVPKRPPENLHQRVRGMPTGPTKAATTNPYGTRMNPNKNIISDDPGIHERNVWHESLPVTDNIVPIDVRSPRIHNLPEAEDVDMSYETSPAVVGQNPSTSQNDELATRRRIARQPLITKRYEPDSLMKSALNAPVTVPMGELMACNPELRKQIIKELQYRTLKMVENQGLANSTYLETEDEPARVNLVRMQPIRSEPIIRSNLIMIKVDLGVGDKKLLVDAIVDSGSGINIVSQSVAHELNKQYPLTPLEEIRCSDANGNQGMLYGQFNNVNLKQANIVTNAAFFVGSCHVNFQLLLGRPWIRGNLVSMDERVEGTYLVYGNPKRPKDYTELLAVDEQWESGTKESANTYFAGIQEVTFQGAWKINEGEEIVEIGPPVTFMMCLARLEDRDLSKEAESETKTRHTGEQQNTRPKEEQGKRKGTLEKGNKDPETDNADPQQITLTEKINKRLNSTMRYQMRRIEHKILALKTLMGHMRRTDQEENMPLTVPQCYPTNNRCILLFNRVRGERIGYSKQVLPLWSIWQTMPDSDDVKVRLCSPAEIYHGLRETTRKLLRQKRTGRRVYKALENDEEGLTNYDHYTLRKPHMQTTMSYPSFQRTTDQEIRLRLCDVTNSESQEPSPVVPPNNIPRPFPLSKSAAYFPITDLTCQTHLVQLQNALFHPNVTGPESFHAILLTANHAVRLETDLFPDYHLQRTFAFNATLAELQGPDGIPISSRVGHAVILFYPGEHERTCALHVGSRTKIKAPIACLGNEIAMHPEVHRREPDSDESTPISSSGSSENEDELKQAWCHKGSTSYRPPSPTAATVANVLPTLARSVIQDVEVEEREDSQGRTARTFVCRLTDRTNPPIPASDCQDQLQGGPLYLLLPPIFVTMTEKLVDMKCDEAQIAFMIPTNFDLSMRLDEGKLSQIIRDLTHPMTMRYDYTARTLYRMANKKGCALLLHHPVFLRTIHDIIFPCKVTPADLSQFSMYDMPQFPASLFILEDSGDCESFDSSITSDSPPPLIDFESSDEEGVIFRPPQKLITYPMPQERELEMTELGLQSPLMENPKGMWSIIQTNTTVAKQKTESASSQESSSRSTFYQPPTPMPCIPPCAHPLDHCILPDYSRPFSPTIQSYFTQIQPPMLPELCSFLEDIKGNNGQLAEIHEQPEEEGWYFNNDQTNKAIASEIPPRLRLDMRLASDESLYSDETPPLSQTFRYSRFCPEALYTSSPSDMSAIEETSRDNSIHSVQGYSTDSSEAYTPMSLDELKRANLQATYYSVESVRVREQTLSQLTDKLYSPRYYACQTTETDSYGNNSALTYILQRHDDYWHQPSEFLPLENGPLYPSPYNREDHPFCHNIAHHYQGRKDNSPLLAEFNGLLPTTHEKYGPIVGSEEYKIAKVGIKIYELMRDLEVKVEDWRHGYANCTQQHIKHNRSCIYTAMLKRNEAKRTGKFENHIYKCAGREEPWGKEDVIEDENRLPPPPSILRFFKKKDLLPWQPHIKEAKQRPLHLETLKLMDGDPGYTFLDVTRTSTLEILNNPWLPAINDIRIARICIHRFLGLIAKQFLNENW
ncbi:uncharacterized protein EV420DRAFT_1639608 [Desarmillaria tabescens]|uniref:Uncharacterized protein n=1 Tax=Armillaria tabescens TaxID=1929756 RepID=A0AA39NB47_ARMTA|nr:uncharacterized protein EV420DRAFT_1639608 [Desarmillaria tabescens]KAK0462391.1 hypothetical protein EV420DRAFT_1639608 [Desarmillaria tabescens]